MSWKLIKHFKWQLFTITDKGIPGPGNNQIAKASRGFAPGPHMGGLQRSPHPHNPQLQSRVFRYAQDAPKCPKLTVTEACPQFLDYPLVKYTRIRYFSDPVLFCISTKSKILSVYGKLPPHIRVHFTNWVNYWKSTFLQLFSRLFCETVRNRCVIENLWTLPFSFWMYLLLLWY